MTTDEIQTEIVNNITIYQQALNNAALSLEFTEANGTDATAAAVAVENQVTQFATDEAALRNNLADFLNIATKTLSDLSMMWHYMWSPPG